MDDKELSGLLFSAIQHHNDSLLDDLLAGESAANLLDVPGDDGNTLLHNAVIENDLNCLVCLLKHGADPNVFDATRARSPLHLAVELGHTEAVKTFLALQHVNLELRDDRNLTCYEIAQFCDNQLLADLILARKDECEGFKDEFYTVMNQACTNNEPRLARELFERYERKIVNNLPKGWQPYRDKRQYSRSMLKELINWSSSSWNNVTLLFKSASKGHTEVCKLLIDFGATAKCSENTNYSPLYVAAYGGHTSTVRLLLDSFPALVQEVTIEKWTVLHACCLQGHSETAKLILNYAYPDSLKRRFVSRSGLYEYQFAFNLNAQDAAGQTVIYLAVSASDETLLDTLLAFNIDAKLIDARKSQAHELAQEASDRRSSSARPLDSGSQQQQPPQHAKIIPDRPRQRQGSSEPVERTSRFYPSNQIDKIMRQLRKLQFSKESGTTSEPICVREASEQGAYLICPFEMDTYCDYNSKTALHLAVCQQFHNIATTLLVNGSNPNLPILFRDSIKGGAGASDSSPSSSNQASSVVAIAAPNSQASGDIGLNWLRSSKSTCLKEACRLNDERMCEILIRYGARDNQDNLALRVAAMNKNHALISMFLSLKSNVDPEFKINRKCNVEFASRYKQSQKLSKLGHFIQGGSGGGGVTTTFSSMFPSAPVTIDWQNLKCIQQLDPQWLIDASLAHNKRLRHPTNSLMAITRLDLSSNNLKSVHPVIFRLPSLRELNLSCNRLETLLDSSAGQQRKMLARDGELMTPTSKLIESQRTAMRRSKSSQFSGCASLENSNVIDLNEPQEWDLPYLEVLDLHDNLLIGLPDCLFELPKLSELDVSSNQLRQLPWAMWTAPSLRELLVAGNQLDDLPKAPPTPQARPSSDFGSPRRLSTISDDVAQASEQHDRLEAPSNQSLDRLDATNSTYLSGSVDSSEANRSSHEAAYLRSLRATSKQLANETIVSSTQVDVEHLNHWSKRVELTSNQVKIHGSQELKQAGEDAASASLFSRLTYLNLAQNSFTSIPPVLACIATELTRLNMSHNRLDSLGDISLYPYKLKNLDMSHNQLQAWFHASHQHDDTKHCYTPESGGQPTARRLSSPSGGQSHQPRFPGTLHCVHKLHHRLDHLRSFNLSHNQLRDIQLLLDPQQQQSSSNHQQASLASSGSPLPRSGAQGAGQRDSNSTAAKRGNLRRHMLLYPNITALDLSFNRIQRVPESLSEFKDLSVLNLSGNSSISSLPPELGLATKLWNLGVNGCHLSEPLKSIVESKTYKTMDIIGYLRSILEEAKPYARMKLMLVGLQGIGKTSLLEQMRLEGSSGGGGAGGSRRRAPEHWTKRMGHTSRSNLRNQKGVTLSTVGVDIHDWVYQKRTPRNQPSFGPVSFSTWDFGGQEEFYATHRYFLSRRSLYLVVWRLTDGLGGILGIQQWLVNIQSRAPGSPVIIVGTHEDMLEGGEQSELAQRLQAEVHRRFMDAGDHDKCGLPRIMDAMVVSTRTKHNIKALCNRIYDVVFSLRCPGSTERLLEQKIPATYLYLEEIVSCIAHERHQKKREPVLNYDEYKRLASEQLKLKYNKSFRDLEPLDAREINYNSELHQATRFLHENGVLLHYEDANLRDLYFLDPQWLCDILSHVVTIREINPHVRNGLMKIDDLGHSFKSMDINLSGGGVQSYVVNLLNKFEVALTWNSQYLLIPSLLPNYPDSLAADSERGDFQVKLAPRMRGRSVVRRQELSRAQAMRSTSIDPMKRNAAKQQQQQQQQLDQAENGLKNFYEFEYAAERAINRLVLLRYLPAGFLARLQSAILSDPAFDDACEDLQLELVQAVLDEEQEGVQFASLVGARPGWLCWKQGIRLALQTESTINTKSSPNLIGAPHLLAIQELNSHSKDLLLNRVDFKIECSQNESELQDHDDSLRRTQASAQSSSSSSPRRTKWIDFDMGQCSNIIVVTLPNPRLKVTRKEDRSVRYFELDRLIMARLLAKAVDYIDDLLEDWYPSLGARFAHTLGGNYLVTRIAPCQLCTNAPLLHQALGYLQQQTQAPNAHQGRASRSSRPSGDLGVKGVRFSISAAAQAASGPNAQAQSTLGDNVVYCYYVEHCILNAYDLTPALQSRAQAPLRSSPIINLNAANKAATTTTTTTATAAPRARNLHCPRHGPIQVASLAPDVVFDDLPEALKIDQDQIERCKLIGRGALGFVFKASLHSAFPLNQLGQANQEVALKLLQPVEPGPEAEQADLAAYNSARANWSREPFQCACKSYCTARHEVNILQAISHPNIVAFIGICQRPLAIVLELAPLGSLADAFKNYKRACSRIDPFTVQKCILQVARALEFLHQQRVIYRDLKSENILVWRFPSPFATALQGAQVELKLADYGISRQALATGIWKGFAGTLSYLAPEILRHNGDEEYTEKVDCFSFGMFLYELLTLRPPYKQQNEPGADNVARAAAAAAAQAPAAGSSFESRPALQKRDLIYPNYMLDLMSLCWSQEPHDRPTASQIVSIATAPEFMQIHDAVELAEPAGSVGSGAAPANNDDGGASVCSFVGAIEHSSANLNLWFGGERAAAAAAATSVINILSTSNQDQWLDCERFELAVAGGAKSAAPITCMCLVEGDLWFCDARGPNVYVTSAAAWSQTWNVSANLEDLEASINNDGETIRNNETGKLRVSSFPLRDRHGKDAKIGQVADIIYVQWAQCVVILSSAGLLWLCKLATMVCEQLEDSSAIRYNCVALPPSGARGTSTPAHSTSPTNASSGNNSLESDNSTGGGRVSGSFQLYCGQSNGISCLEICDGEVRRQSILPLAGSGAQTPSQEVESIDDSLTSAEISHIVTSNSDEQQQQQQQLGDQLQLLWTAADCMVHLWSIRSKHVIRKLECWKLVPCSESLESINIEHYYQEAKTSRVTSLVLLREQLFVGTSHGCFIVIEANTLKPMTVFRPYESQVTIVRPLVLAGGSHQPQRDERPGEPQHLVAVGRGYRDLMRRYLVGTNLDSAEAPSSPHRQQAGARAAQRRKGLVAILLTASSHYNL